MQLHKRDESSHVTASESAWLEMGHGVAVTAAGGLGQADHEHPL